MKKKKEKIKTRRVTIVIPESAYQFFKKMTVAANQATVTTGESLNKVSDIIRETLTRGLVEWKKISKEADKRLKEKAKKELKKLKK